MEQHRIDIQRLEQRVVRLETLLHTAEWIARRRLRTLALGGCLVLAAALFWAPSGATAVSLPTDQPMPSTAIDVGAVWANFDELAAAVTSLETVSISDAVTTSCDGDDASCGFDDLLSAAITVGEDRLVRFELVPVANGHISLPADSGNSHIEFHLERRAGVGAWTPVSSTSFRFTGSGADVSGIPCSSIVLLDQSSPGPGTYEYRLAATWLDTPGPGFGATIEGCAASLRDAGHWSS